MNNNELIDFLKNPSILTSGNLDEIEDIIRSYPYFQGARILLAKGSRELKHPKTKIRIGSAAVYSTDRPLLKKYLSGQLIFLSGPARHPLETSASMEPGHADVRSETGEIKVPSVPSESLDSILDELKNDMEELKSSRIKFSELQRQIEEEEAVSAALTKASVKKVEGHESPEEVNEEPGVKPKKLKEKTKEATREISETVSQTKEIIEAVKTEVISEAAEKKKTKSPTKKTESKDSEKTKSAPKKIIKPNTVARSTAHKSPDSKAEKTPEKDDDDAGGQEKTQDQIMRNFIQKSPSISKTSGGGGDRTNDDDLSDHSVQWNRNLASEYLAEVYLKQGHKQRAIEIYRSLSLKFPKKKSYFADLISKIE